MFFITEDAKIICKHPVGVVKNVPSQNWLTIAKRRVLVATDPEGRTIDGCNNTIPGSTVKCTATMIAQEGYSKWIHVGGKSVVLDTLTGFTTGQPPGLFKYVVVDSGQPFVEERA
jgi:hypothetical protein